MADSAYLSIEAVADEADLSAGNSQMTPIVTGGTIKADTATFTNWPLEGKTRTARYSATTASGGCYSSVTPSGASGGWERLLRMRFGAYPAAQMSFWQLRPATGANCELKMSSAGVITAHNAAGTVVKTFAAIAVGAYYIGVYTKPDVSVGEFTMTVWDTLGNVIETWSAANLNLGAGPFVSERVGSKINSGAAVWDAWFGVVDHNHTNETALTLSPPISVPVAASHVDSGWIYDDSTDATAGTLNISNVVLTPTHDYVIDQANRRVAVEVSDEVVAYSYRVTNATTTRNVTVGGSIPAAGGTPSAAMLVRKIGGVLVEVL